MTPVSEVFDRFRKVAAGSRRFEPEAEPAEEGDPGLALHM
jgi:hypothetical protein